MLDDRDEVLGMMALKLGLPLNTADDERPGPDRRRVPVAAALPPRFSSDDYNNLLAGDAWLHQTWSGDMAALLWQADDPSMYGYLTPSEGSPVNSDAYAIPRDARHPGTALLFIDYMLRPENVEKNINWIGYPMPVHGTEDAYEALVADFPACRVTLEDLESGLYFDVDSSTRRRPATRRTPRSRWADDDDTRPPDGAAGDRRRSTHPVRAPVDLAAGARHAWMALFFVSALLLMVALSFGTTDALGNPRFGTTLDNFRQVFDATYLRVLLRSLVYAATRLGDLPGARLPGRLRHRATRRPLQEPR